MCLGGILKYANATRFLPAKPIAGGGKDAAQGGGRRLPI